MTDDRLSILIVDDDEVDRMAVERALRTSTLAVDLTNATSCQDAIDRLQSQSFSCLLLDYYLPDGNALDFIQRLKPLDINIPIIVLTGQGDENIAVDLMKAGASDYVSKGKLSPKLLSQAIRAAIRVYRAEQEVIKANHRLRATNLLLKEQNHRLEQQKQKIHLQNLQLIEASNLKSQFLTSMSHELRTPMHAIMGFSQILIQGVKGDLNDAQIKMVERIIDNSQNLLSLLNDLLDFSKIESGQLEIKRERFNLAKLVLSTVEELRSLVDQKGIELRTSIELKDRSIISDEGRLRQILINLLSNAIKFTEKGSVNIRAYDDSDQTIAIAVQDTGIGIPETKLDIIFDEFRQVNQSTSRRYQGTGLGLAISKSLAELMQASIQVESQVNQGSTFTIVLPTNRDSSNEPEP